MTHAQWRSHECTPTHELRADVSIHMNCFLHIVAVLAASTAATGNVRADAATQREDQFKAAYVFNFVKFVAWPDTEASDTLTICFVGGDGVYAALTDDIADKRAGDRSLAALKLSDTSSADICNALYIEASMMQSYDLELSRPVLTISDAANFTAKGGMIGLFSENHRLRFVINAHSASQAGLRISSDLLKLAAHVQRGP
jgi:hypothetical protein